MTKIKSTKRALLASALALVLCVSMLVGSTFAWFTDSVTTAGNTIQSGTLRVDLVDEKGASLENKVLAFEDLDGNNLWEPGCTYKTQKFFVKNNGNLALQYQIVINGIEGNAKLLEAIEWTITVGGVETDVANLEGKLLQANDQSEAIVLSGHMKEEAGNEYQGLTVEGISVSVFATQYTYEFDSEDDQYDATAEYAATTMLKNVAAVAAGESATVKLESDGYLVVNNESPIGAKIVGDVTVDLNGKTFFVKAEDGSAHMSLFHIAKTGKLTVTGNGTIKMVTGANQLVTAIFNNDGGTLVIKNGTYKMDYPNDSKVSLIPTIVDTNSNVGAATTIIDGGEFYHTRNMFRNFAQPYNVASLIINGGTFNGEADDWAAIWNQKTSSSSAEGQGLVTINGGTFNYVSINNNFKTGVTIADGVVMPVPVSTADELKDALADGENVTLANDVVNVPVNTKAPYGNYYGVAQNGGVFDGNGKNLDFNEGELHNGRLDNYGIMTSGGTIKNVDITGVFRGIMIMYPTEDIYIDNVTLGGEDMCYTINTGEGDGTHSLIVTNSTIPGWASFGTAIKDLSFTNCTFVQGEYYTDVFGRIVKPYVDTVFENCEFNSKFYLDLSQLGKDGDGNILNPDAKIVLKNCTVNGVKLTAENWKELIASESDCGEGQISIEGKNGSYMTASNIFDYVIIE